MNADFNSSMTQWDRYNLIVPDRVVNQILSQCEFPQDQICNLKIDPDELGAGGNRDFQDQFVDESSCIVCKLIPINAKECAYCNKIICFLCECKSAFQQIDGKRIEQRQCPSCNVVEQRNITAILDDHPVEKFDGVTVHGFNGNPGPTTLQPLYRNVQNKLMKQMLGQIKVKHRCNPDQDYQHVFLADLDKHIWNKCQGFKIRCVACKQYIKTVKGMLSHIKYHCPELQIQCFFCTESFTRASFRDVSVHPCRLHLDQIFQKLKGGKVAESGENGNKQQEGGGAASLTQLEQEYFKHFQEGQQRSQEDDQEQIQAAEDIRPPTPIENYVAALKLENEHLKKTTIDASTLPIATQLLCVRQQNSLINMKQCVDPTCLQNYRIQGSGARCLETLSLVKEDGAQAGICRKCNLERYCRMYQCSECSGTFCHYCLVDEEKKVLLGLIDENFDPNCISDQSIFGSESNNVSQDIKDLVVPKPRNEQIAEQNIEKDKQKHEAFGKYYGQYNLFEKWPAPVDFFTMQQQWADKHFKVQPFDFLNNSKHIVKPKFDGPDKLELELVSIKKHQNYVYEGQVLAKNQVFHGFGRILQYQPGPDDQSAYVYEGWFINGLAHGYGRKINIDGSQFEGNFMFGLENGVGFPSNSYLN